MWSAASSSRSAEWSCTHRLPVPRPAPAQPAIMAPSTGSSQSLSWPITRPGAEASASRSRSWSCHAPEGCTRPWDLSTIRAQSRDPSSTRSSSWASSSNRSRSRAPSPFRLTSVARSWSPHASVEQLRVYFHSSSSVCGAGDARLNSGAWLPAPLQPTSLGAPLAVMDLRSPLDDVPAACSTRMSYRMPIPLCRKAVHPVPGAARRLGSLLMQVLHSGSRIRGHLGGRGGPGPLRGRLSEAGLLLLTERRGILAPIHLPSLGGRTRSSPRLTLCLLLPPCAL